MTITDIAAHRLVNQQIVQSNFKTPRDLVSWLGAVQAQDFAGSFWAIGLRLPNSTEDDIKQAINKKEIIRTWPMRGTLHFVAAEDAKWMLNFLTPRVISKTASIFRGSGLDDAVFKKSAKIIAKALQGEQQLTRRDLYERLEKAKISTENQRGLHILGYWAQKGLICLGPHHDKQPSFVLLDEWLPESKDLYGDEALAALAKRYFTSHGPATIQDFAWWSGLTLTEARKGLESIKDDLHYELYDQQEYWMPDNESKKIPLGVQLLPSFDEYLVAYKDRAAAFDPQYLSQIVKSGNGIFSPVIVYKGRVVGTWKRVMSKDKVQISLETFSQLSKSQLNSIETLVKQYGKFLSKEVSLAA